MNLLLIRDDELVGDQIARITGDRARHLSAVMKVSPGQVIRVGRPGGMMGRAEVFAIEADGSITLEFLLTEAPPPKPGIDLILAMPRPKVLARILEHATALGAGRIALIRSWRVERAYLESPILASAELAAHIHLGLEQSGDTIAPTVTFHPLFKPFVEDTLPGFAVGASGFVPHPGAPDVLSRDDRPAGRRVILAIGPEGGWLDYEVAAFAAQGFLPRRFGPRILRVETAVAFAFGRLG